MQLPKIILVPTDFSELATEAVEYAIALAAKLDAQVQLFHAVSIPAAGYDGLVASLVEAMMSDAQRALDKLVAQHGARARFAPPRCEIGDARGRIDAFAREIQADLIVLGTHGRHGVSRLLIGSVAEAVARMAPCPVLLVRHVAS